MATSVTGGYPNTTTFTPLVSGSHAEANTTDNSSSDHPIYWDLTKVLIMLVTMIVLLVGVVGNVTILLAICIRRMLKSPLSCYMVNLAVVHLVLSLVVCPMLTFQILRDSRYEPATCGALFSLLYSLALLLASSIMIIGLDRVCREMCTWFYMTHHSCRLALLIVAICWAVVAIVVTSLELGSTVEHPLRSQLCAPQHTEVPAERSGASQPEDSVAEEVVLESGFMVTYIISMICMVLMLGVQGSKQSREADKNIPGTNDVGIVLPSKVSMAGLQRSAYWTKSQGGTDVQDARSIGAIDRPPVGGASVGVLGGARRGRRGSMRTVKLRPETYEDRYQTARAARVFVLLVALHTVCWLPFYVVHMLHIHGLNKTSVTTAEVTHYMALLSSAIYPAIFYMFSVEFNTLIRQLLRVMCCKSSHLHSGSVVTLDLDDIDDVEDDLQYRAALGELEPDMSSEDIHSVTQGASGHDRVLSPIASSAEMLALDDSDGQSLQPDGKRKMKGSGRRKRRRRKSDIDDLLEAEAGMPGSPSGQSSAGGSAEGTLSPRSKDHHSSRGGSARTPGSGALTPETAGSDRHSSRPGQRLLSGLKTLFRRTSPSGGSSSPEPSSSRGSASSDSRHKSHGGVRGLMANLANLGRPRERSASEQELVRKLVLAGLPSGVHVSARPQGARPQDRPGTDLTGVWRSSSGTIYRLDPEADNYDDLLHRMAEYEEGYESPTGQRIHHVCAKHHVHHQCHHHDIRRMVEERRSSHRLPPTQETSINNWTSGEAGTQQVRPRRDRAREEFGALLHDLSPPSTPPRKARTPESPDDGPEIVKQVHNM